ncbi:MAG: tRNA (N6-isopentenyl adenosine(37)-C2)-methylthiotransferase MiaB [Proteobacteria bacterium]|nr:tRNA (N6-isopentenyl adenosine(37)-C2)-methylthiotransferase MiaB [Pseudomonadota bacterium]
MRKFHIHTFGCQMNERDSERIAAWLSRAGHVPAADEARADLIIINTCSIRKKAEDKVYSLLGRLEKDKRSRPDMILAVAGCVAEQEGENLLRRFPGLNLVFGTHQVGRVAALVEKARAGERVSLVGSLPDADRLEGYRPFHRAPGVSTFVTIMEGCDNWCSYCVVPALRGRELCRPPEEIANEIKSLVETGYREFTLIGQNVNSYRCGNGFSFPGLLRLAAGISGVGRLRFATSHPKDLSPDLIRAFAEIPNLARHIHLPAQSGSNRVLAAMNRRYTREDYLEKVERLRTACPGIAITTDIIIGFPGEEESDFRQTLDLLEEVRFDGSFSFVYSPRPGTRAADLAGPVEGGEGRRRLKIFQDRQDEITLELNQALVGRVHEVLIEGINPRPQTRQAASLTGRDSGNKIVHFPGSPDLIRKITPVRITEAAIHSLRGTIENNLVSS